jgi:hypothetical protein
VFAAEVVTRAVRDALDSDATTTMPVRQR